MLNGVLLNGVLLDASEAGISPVSDGFLYGRGLYETIKLLGGKPVFFRDHFDRLHRSAAELGLGWVSTAAELAGRCRRLAEANGASDAVLKIVIFEDRRGAAELLLTRDNPYPTEKYKSGFSLKSVWGGKRSGELHSLKTLNQLTNITTRAKARAEGWDDALFYDSDGTLYEGAATNVFLVVRGRVLTPALDTFILPGVARGRVLRLKGCARAQETAVTLAQAQSAEEAFVTNSLLGVMPVSRIDGHEFDLGKNPVTRAILEAFRAAELESIGE